MKTQGWGHHPTLDSNHLEPAFQADVAQLLGEKSTRSARNADKFVIPRGAGRSYGDSALAATVLSSRYLDRFISFDTTNGELSCESGVTLDQILAISVPKGWILPVLPGTRFVTVGGAIASDFHVKNHHLEGCFSNHIKSVHVMLASGEIVQCSPARGKNLFRATCGGMGLTGVILKAKLKLRKIESSNIQQRTLSAANLSEIFQLFDQNSHSQYSVAWLDCLAKNQHLGRSLLMLGEHASEGELITKRLRTVSVPSFSPGFVLNRFTVKAFNSAYLQLKSLKSSNRLVHYDDYFFPLDGIRNWNRLYGSKGFLQYQVVIPDDAAEAGIKAVLNETSSAGKGSFLTVLKKLGPANGNFLSFPMQGYTLALDFKYETTLLPLLERLDEIVLAHGGRHYLAKDARMNESTFKHSYPEWEKFCKIRNYVDPHNTFGSEQSTRLGLT
jgi:FAD/FMN-containing dehydrogenase